MKKRTLSALLGLWLAGSGCSGLEYLSGLNPFSTSLAPEYDQPKRTPSGIVYYRDFDGEILQRNFERRERQLTEEELERNNLGMLCTWEASSVSAVSRGVILSPDGLLLVAYHSISWEGLTARDDYLFSDKPFFYLPPELVKKRREQGLCPRMKVISLEPYDLGSIWDKDGRRYQPHFYEPQFVAAWPERDLALLQLPPDFNTASGGLDAYETLEISDVTPATVHDERFFFQSFERVGGYQNLKEEFRRPMSYFGRLKLIGKRGAVKRVIDESYMIEGSVALKGSSGGPVYDSKGRLFGSLSAITDKGARPGTFVAPVHEFLEHVYQRR